MDEQKKAFIKEVAGKLRHTIITDQIRGAIADKKKEVLEEMNQTPFVINGETFEAVRCADLLKTDPDLIDISEYYYVFKKLFVTHLSYPLVTSEDSSPADFYTVETCFDGNQTDPDKLFYTKYFMVDYESAEHNVTIIYHQNHAEAITVHLAEVARLNSEINDQVIKARREQPNDLREKLMLPVHE